jgi:hypothetical protein
MNSSDSNDDVIMISSDNVANESDNDEEDQEMGDEFHLRGEDQHKIWKIGMSDTLK